MVGQRGSIQPKARSVKRENVAVPYTVSASESYIETTGQGDVCFGALDGFPVIVSVIATTRRFLAINELDRGMSEGRKLQRIDREV